MTRLKTLILMLCLIMSAAFCKANGVISITNDGAPITLIKASDYGGSDRSGSMLAYINGHTLTVAFTENLGTVLIEIQDETGSPLDLTLLGTPTGYQCYIPLAGRYTLLIKLDNDDVYSGEFEVED